MYGPDGVLVTTLVGGAPVPSPRVDTYIEANPGCSMRVLRDGVNGRAASIKKVVEQLTARGAVEDRGNERCASLYAVGGGSQGGSRPGTAKTRDAVPDSGSAPVPIEENPEPLPSLEPGSQIAPRRGALGNRLGAQDKVRI